MINHSDPVLLTQVGQLMPRSHQRYGAIAELSLFNYTKEYN